MRWPDALHHSASSPMFAAPILFFHAVAHFRRRCVIFLYVPRCADKYLHTLSLQASFSGCSMSSQRQEARCIRGISSVGRAVASHATGQGFESPMLHLIPETESENNLVRFLFCIDFQHLRPLRHCTLASDATALPGAKQHQKVKKPKHA